MIQARELEELLSQPDDELITQITDIKTKRSAIGGASRKLVKKPAIDSTQIMTSGNGKSFKFVHFRPQARRVVLKSCVLRMKLTVLSFEPKGVELKDHR